MRLLVAGEGLHRNAGIATAERVHAVHVHRVERGTRTPERGNSAIAAVASLARLLKLNNARHDKTRRGSDCSGPL
jgi:hypothetical protein